LFTARTARIIGDLDFGPEAAIDYNALRLRWFDYHLKGLENGIMNEPSVRIFVMGENRWRDENEFPLSRAIATEYFFRQGPSGSVDSKTTDFSRPHRRGAKGPIPFARRQ